MPPTTITPEARASAPVPAATVYGVSAMYIILCTLVVAARMIARFAVHQRIWWDDWTMLLAWAGLIILCVQQFIMVSHGGGVEFSEVPTSEFKEFVKTFSGLEIVARLAIFFAKLSILLLYIRIFFPPRSTKTGFYWLIQITIWANLLYTIALILVVTLQCVPRGLPYGSECVNEALVLIMASVINIVSDFVVLFIPLGAVWHLQISRNRKWGLLALFGFGALAPISSIARLAYQIPEADAPDKTVIFEIIPLLATAEQVIAIIVGSVPIASAWVLARKSKSSERDRKGNRTTTERLKPSRESGRSDGSGSGSRKTRQAPELYNITRATVAGDEEDSLELQPSAKTSVSAEKRSHEMTKEGMEDMGARRAYGISTTSVQVEVTPRHWP